MVAARVGDLKFLTDLVDRALPARDHGINRAQLIRFVEPDGDLPIDQRSNSPRQGT